MSEIKSAVGVAASSNTGKSDLTSARSNVLAAAKALAPIFKERAVQADRDRAIPRANYDAMRDAGLFQILKPKKYGGFELTVHDHAMVTLTLARACASTAWVYSLLNGDNAIVTSYPEEAQDDIWKTNHTATLAGSTFLNNKSRATRVKGGYKLTGQWSFCSGSDFAEWLVFSALVDDGTEGHWFLVPKEETTTIDDWHPTGMRGTGSRSLATKDSFVPEHRVILGKDVFRTDKPRLLHPNFDAIQPPWPYGMFIFSAVAVGAAYSAIDYFVDTGTSNQRLASLQGGQLRLSDSDLVASEFAEVAGELDMAAKLIEIRSLEAAERSRTRNFATDIELAADHRDNAILARLALRAVQRIFSLVGSKAGFPDHPVSRAKRDVEMLANHVTLNWRQAAVQYSNAVLGSR